MKLVLSSGWSKESWAVKHSNQVLQDFPTRNICWNAFKISFLRSITDHKYQKWKDRLHQTEPTKPLLGMIIYFLKFLFIQNLSWFFTPFKADSTAHAGITMCLNHPHVYSDLPTLRPAQLGGFEKSRWPCSVGAVVSIGTNEKWILPLESCNICVLAGGSEVTGSFHSEYEASRTIQYRM